VGVGGEKREGGGGEGKSRNKKGGWGGPLRGGGGGPIRNLQNTDFVDRMIVNVLRDLPFIQNDPMMTEH